MEEQIRQDILEAKAQFENQDTQTSSSTNPLSHFRFRVVLDLKCNEFDKSLPTTSNISSEWDHIVNYALTNKNFEMLKQSLWFIRDQDDMCIRRALITEYIRVCCYTTDEAVNDCVDQLLEYLHQDIESTWQYDINLLFELLHMAGVNVEKLCSLLMELGIKELLNDVQLILKLNYDDKTKSQASQNQIINSIKCVFRIVLSLCYFQVEKLKSNLSNDNYLFLFLLGFYLQLDRRFQDINTIHIARRLMINALTLITTTYWNDKRDLLVKCLYSLSLKNVYIVELFLKTNERTVRIRTQLALLHLKRLVNMIEHEKKSEAMIIDEIIQHKLNPRLFERQIDFIDCVRLLGDIVDSYPIEQRLKCIAKLYAVIQPYTKTTHEKLLTDEHVLLLFDDWQRWATMLKPYMNDDDVQKRLKRK
ncbi:unnamed protein product [Adineta ricciae]|uniref:Uncharacterized protein n=1 Tax=Adineta ricciae TaxID=249248 RepID=A0A814B4J7_ADIRI|nr:unnamed protein product [Adineta ricciae]CAF0921814.1 unnamed protein product [Adineta ricciae]